MVGTTQALNRTLIFIMGLLIALMPRNSMASPVKEVVFTARLSTRAGHFKKKHRPEMHLIINRDLHAQIWGDMYLIADCQVTPSRVPVVIEFSCHPKNDHFKASHASLKLGENTILRYGSHASGFREAHLYVEYNSLNQARFPLLGSRRGASSASRAFCETDRF